MKRIVINTLFFLLVIPFMVSGQQKKANISFNETSFDFGKIKEENGPVEHRFEFVNSGGEPLIIENVRASCGCTTPAWTKTPVAPGQSGFVSASYNPKGRPGAFNKSITITSNSDGSPHTLIISGEVIPQPQTKEDEFPFKLGELNLQSNRLSFIKIYNNEIKEENLPVYNNTQKPIKIGFEKIPAHLSIKGPETLKPGEEGKITVTFDAKKKKEWDNVEDKIDLVINGKKDASYVLYVNARIVEDFSKLTKEQAGNAPKINFTNKALDFGTKKSGEMVTGTFTFKNEGKSELIIRKINSNCTCLTTKAQKIKIAPGKTGEIAFAFDTKGFSSMQNKLITVVTNDPENSGVNLFIKGVLQ